MTSIFDNVYSIIYTFFPSSLIEIPFFEFIINLAFFFFGCWLFSIFFLFPLTSLFKWVKRKIGGL